MITDHSTLPDLLRAFGFSSSELGGIEIWRLGDLARAHGVTRWKRAPAGTGSNVGIVRLSLNSHGLAIYSHHAVAETHTNGNLMTDPVLKELQAGDHVIVLNRDYSVACAIADGSAGLTHDVLPEELIEMYRGDRIRAANHHDVNRVIEQIIFPHFTTSASS